MSKRLHNIFFHLHTVSGIVISVLLFIIFFTGAFALVKDEITAWEKGTPVNHAALKIDYNRIMDSLSQQPTPLYGRDLRIIPPDAKQQTMLILSNSQDTSIHGGSDFFYMNTESYARSGYFDFYSLGELLYRFHFFHQIPFGVYIAGFVAFFFLFAIITGLVIHWKKIISNFYTFRPKAKLKRLWTDAHTALGVLGLPFQVVYAVTSCFLCLSIFVLIPANIAYKGDQKALMESLRPMMKTYPLEARSTDRAPNLNACMDAIYAKIPDFEPVQIYIRNIGDVSMKFQVDGKLPNNERFVSHGRFIFNAYTGEVEDGVSPFLPNYLEEVEQVVRTLHFGDFGGMPLKMVYFALAWLTCFVILSGVFIWLEARKKLKRLTDKQKRFNQNVGRWYTALCMSLLPATACSFVLAKTLPEAFATQRFPILHACFFGVWLLASLAYRLQGNLFFIAQNSLRIGGGIGLLIPVLSAAAGHPFWQSWSAGHEALLLIDLLWCCIGGLSVWASFRMQPRKELLPRRSKKEAVA